MPVTITTDDALKRVTVRVPEGTRWNAFVQAVLEAIEDAPHLTDRNWIIDDQGPMADVDVAGMSRIGEAFNRLAGASQRCTHTVVVTTDRFFPAWARVIDLTFGSRKHHAAPTLAAAVGLLDRLEAADRSAGA